MQACSAPDGEADAAAALLELITGFEVTQALRAAVDLGIADLLAGGPMTAQDLATASGTHEPWITRLLRYLEAFGLVSEDQSGRFGATSMSDLLRRDHPRSLRPTAIFLSEPWFQEPYAQLAVAMRSGGAPFERVHGLPIWQYLEAHPDHAAVLGEALATLRAQRDAAVVEVCDLAGVGTVVDVAGGNGNFVVAMLQSYPAMRGVLFELPSVASRAASALEASAMSHRCSVVAGDMFAAVPRGGDVYVLANVIHDWPDEESIQILTNCHQAMDGTGRLILVEQVVVPGAMRRSIASADLRMMTTFGDARQRTEAEFPDAARPEWVATHEYCADQDRFQCGGVSPNIMPSGDLGLHQTSRKESRRWRRRCNLSWAGGLSEQQRLLAAMVARMTKDPRAPHDSLIKL